ncbi:hypothetical protein Tco_0651237 [Tanacetum coccineum]
MTKINKKQYIADVRVMNYLLQAIPNDIYNSMDAHSRLMDEFDKFAAKEGESLESVYERLTTLVNIMDRHTVSYNQLYDSLAQFEPHIQASKAKRAARNHDPLALIAHLNVSSQSHAKDYQGELHGDAQEDKLTTEMLLLAQDGRVDIQTKNAGYGGNGNRNVGRQNRNQAFNARNVNGESHYARDCQKPRVRDAKYFREQMLLAMKDEAESNLNAKENDYMLDNSFGDETLEELTAAVIIMARIQPTDGNAVTDPTYDAKAISEVNSSHKAHEQVNHVKRKTIIHASNNDQIDFNIIFDDPYVENNGGTSEHDSNDHAEYHNIQILAYNVQKEARNKNRLNNELKSKKSCYKRSLIHLEHEIRADKDTIERILKEKDKIESDFFKIENEKIIIQHETQLAKKDFKERENRYLEDIVDLKEKLSSHDRIIYNIGQSIQTIHLLGKTLTKVYDPFLKAGLGYQNLKSLKKAIVVQLKMYHGEMLYTLN